MREVIDIQKLRYENERLDIMIHDFNSKDEQLAGFGRLIEEFNSIFNSKADTEI